MSLILRCGVNLHNIKTMIERKKKIHEQQNRGEEKGCGAGWRRNKLMCRIKKRHREVGD